MEAAQALRELTELSTQITAAVVLDSEGAVLAAFPDESSSADRLRAAAVELVAAAGQLGGESRDVTRVEVELEAGAVFVLREGERTVAALTGPNPTSGLVVYDLRTCVQAIDPPESKKRRSTRKKESAE